uniref:Glutamate receptor ionotropic, NMDA 1 n=1 Tax=Cryptocotyle lingua TaxID=66766 RepID=A0A7U0YEQ8_9TREM|nr:glutamate receptor ionotropic, NMDA 1 [Cryptocotyle lingua]
MLLSTLLITLLSLQSNSAVEFTIGALVSDKNVLENFERLVNSVSEGINDNLVRFNAKGGLLSLNALKATEQVCSLFNATKGKMLALIVSHPSGAVGAPPLSVSFTTSFYYVPTIGISARQATFSDKYSHVSFLRTVPPYSREAAIWADLIVAFGWREVCVIHSDDQDAKALLSGLDRLSVVDSSGKKYFKIMRQVAINTDEEDAARVRDFVSLLRPIRSEQTRAILLFLRRSFAEYIFAAARKLGMLDAEWAWIVTEQALYASNIPQGVIGVRLLQSSELDHLTDAIRVATQGILSMARAYPHVMPVLRAVSACREDPLEIQSQSTPRGPTYNWNEYARKLYNHMLQVNFSDGRTGRVEFDQRGDRVRPVYEIVNAQFPREELSGTATQTSGLGGSVFGFQRPELVPIGQYGNQQGDNLPIPLSWYSPIPYPRLLSINMSAIVWPGNLIDRRAQLVCVQRDEEGACRQTDKQIMPSAPISFKKKTHLRVVTALSKPFVNKRPKLPGERCNESDEPTQPKMEVECTHTDPETGVVSHYCCFGFCIDLLRHLANRTGFEVNPTLFTYDLHLVGDGQIGEEVVENDTRRWTGVVGEILSGMADLAVAPISITPERAARVEFSKPFKYLGITILIKRERAKSNLGSFLQPFENTLWVLVALSVHAVAWVLYLLDRFSPFGLGKPSFCALEKPPSDMKKPSLCMDKHSGQHQNPSNDTPKEGLTLSSAVYFAWGVLLNSGIGEGTPRAFCARVLGMVWAGFAMIIVASYTANLAAFLVLDRPESSISGIDDMRLRNPQKDFTFGTVRGSAVDMYFKRQMEYSTMYRVMQSYNRATIEEAVEAVKSGALKAFIWDSPRLNLEAASNCDLVTAGEVFGRSGYGLAMKKGNPWLEELSQAVLNFHERGIMEQLDSLWILVNADDCERTESSPATLGLTNMAGVFIMVAAGIISGVFITFVEIACAKKRRTEEHHSHLAMNAFHVWRENVQKKRLGQETDDMLLGKSCPPNPSQCILSP